MKNKTITNMVHCFGLQVNSTTRIIFDSYLATPAEIARDYTVVQTMLTESGVYPTNLIPPT